MYAIIGVIKGAQVDGPESVRCVGDGFATTEAADLFRTEYKITGEQKDDYEDLLREEYSGDHWAPCGGFVLFTLVKCCYPITTNSSGTAVRMIFRKSCTASVRLIGADGVRTRGKHAWIEHGSCVFDCGSYVFRIQPWRNTRYYEVMEAVPDGVIETYEEIKEIYQNHKHR